MVNIKNYFLTQLNIGSLFISYFKLNLRSLIFYKILQIFTAISNNLYLSILSHYLLLNFSQTGSSKRHQNACIYLQINIFLYEKSYNFH